MVAQLQLKLVEQIQRLPVAEAVTQLSHIVGLATGWWSHTKATHGSYSCSGVELSSWLYAVASCRLGPVVFNIYGILDLVFVSKIFFEKTV